MAARQSGKLVREALEAEVDVEADGVPGENPAHGIEVVGERCFADRHGSLVGTTSTRDRRSLTGSRNVRWP